MHRQFDALVADFHPPSDDLLAPPDQNRPLDRPYLHNQDTAPYICTHVVQRTTKPGHQIVVQPRNTTHHQTTPNDARSVLVTLTSAHAHMTLP